MANAGLRDEEKIRDGIKRADFVRKGKARSGLNGDGTDSTKRLT